MELLLLLLLELHLGRRPPPLPSPIALHRPAPCTGRGLTMVRTRSMGYGNTKVWGNDELARYMPVELIEPGSDRLSLQAHSTCCFRCLVAGLLPSASAPSPEGPCFLPTPFHLNRGERASKWLARSLGPANTVHCRVEVG